MSITVSLHYYRVKKALINFLTVGSYHDDDKHKENEALSSFLLDLNVTFLRADLD